MSLKIKYLGWDAFIVTTKKGVNILLDPFLTGNEEQSIKPSPVGIDELGPIDLIATSHGSHDHFGNTFEIMEKYKNTKLLCGIDMLHHANQKGYDFDRIVPMVSGSRYKYEDVTIRALDARHISFTMLNGHPVTGNPMCFAILTDDGHSIFFGGDTSLSYDLKLYGELYRPSIAMLGVGGALIGGRTLEELDPFEAAIAAEFLGAKTIIPMHYREVETAKEFAENLKLRAPYAEARIMEPGETIQF